MKLTEVNADFSDMTQDNSYDDPFKCMQEVYMDEYIALDIPRSLAQLHHVANAMMTGIHDMLPLNNDDDEYAIYFNIVLKKEGSWAVIKIVIGFDFDGNPGEHTIWIANDHSTDISSKFEKVNLERRAQ